MSGELLLPNGTYNKICTDIRQWLKAPYLNRAVEAEDDMLEGLRGLLASE